MGKDISVNKDIFDSIKIRENTFMELVGSILEDENINEETGSFSSGTSGSYSQVIAQLQRRAYDQSFLKALSPVLYSGIPNGTLLTFSAEYAGAYGNVGKGSKDQARTQLFVITFPKDDIPTFEVGDEKVTDDGVALKIVYFEEENPNFVVAVDEGQTLVQYSTIDGKSIELINSAQFGSGQLFKNYGSWQETSESEKDENIHTLELKTYSQEMKPVTAKIRTDMTLEFLQDLQATLKITKTTNNSGLILRKVLRDVLTLTMEQKYLEFAKWKATLRPTLVLRDGLGTQTSLTATYKDIYANINLAIGEIGTDTMTSRKYFVAASSNVVAALKTLNAIKQIPVALKNISNLVGVLGNDTYLIEDPYSLEDYFLVGLRGDGTIINYPSVVYLPYGLDFYSVMNPDTDEESLGGMMRMVLAENGIDRPGKNEGESLQACIVDMSGLTNQSLR